MMVRCTWCGLSGVTVAMIAALGLVACGEAPAGDVQAEDASDRESPVQEALEIQTRIGPFTITSVTRAERFPVGCTFIPGFATNCHLAREGMGLVIIQVRNSDAEADPDFPEAIQDDFQDVEVMADDGETWELGVWQSSMNTGIELVFSGPGLPASFEMTWPGNEPVTLTLTGG